MTNKSKRTGGAHSKPAGSAKETKKSRDKEKIMAQKAAAAAEKERLKAEKKAAAAAEKEKLKAEKMSAAAEMKAEVSEKEEIGPDKRAVTAEKKTSRAEKKAAKKAEKAAGKEETKSRSKKGLQRLKLTLIIIFTLFVMLIIGAAAGGYVITNSSTNLPNVYIGEYFVGGMTKSEALQVLEDNDWDEAASYALRVKLPAKVSFKLDMCKSGAMFSKEGAVDAAYRYGHSENIFVNLYRYLMNMVVPVDVSVEYQRLNDDYIRKAAQDGIDRFKERTADKGNVIDKEEEFLRMMKGAGQMEINLDSLCQAITDALLSEQKLLEYKHIDNTLSMPDFDALYNELAAAPEDAYYTENFDVVDEVVGCSFDIEGAKTLWNEAEPGSYIEIPLNISYPEITGDQLRSQLFRDKLGSQITYYYNSVDNRISNINLCASKIDGIILYPGDTFSFNETVGQRTEEAGFLPAGAYADGEVVEEVGGGICQVSSTLYCAAMYAQMETVARTNHYFPVPYLPLGFDATVSWPSPDYKFKNNRTYPVKIAAYCDNNEKSITIEIWGTDVDGSYVEINFSKNRLTDPTYGVIIGWAGPTTRNVYDVNGNLISQIVEPYNTYHLHDEEIAWPEGAGSQG